ncbi:MAG: L-threonylcarbamoyladenylate synthase [Candidatus Pacebacteria bacterium]|nr:L-threonylcarbamoyladenylate synthase [Candidatus Paceibacterota bacterium]
MRIIKTNQKNLREVIKIAIISLKKGKVLVCPTDTVYGLICDAKNDSAIRRIFKIKKRSFQKPLSIFVKNLKTAKKLAIINGKQEKILKKNWPGKLIAVFKAKKKFPKGIVCEFGKIGLRVPDYKLLNDLLDNFSRPLTQTSANISGELASNKIKDVLNQFQNKKNQPDLVIDAGNLKPLKLSRVIDFTGEKPKILRG